MAMLENNRGESSNLIRWILTPTVSGTVAFVVVQPLVSDLVFELTAAIFVAGLAAVLMTLAGVEKRLLHFEVGQSRLVELTRHELTTGLDKINERAELLRLIDLSSTRRDVMLELARDWARLDPGSALIPSFAEGELVKLSRLLNSLAAGSEAIHDGEDQEWLLGLTRNAGSTIVGVGLMTVDASGRGLIDGGLWPTDLGQRFLEAQRNAVERGVTVRRLFIVERGDHLDDANFRAVWSWHRDRGVEVRTLDSSITAGTGRLMPFDFLVFDNALCYEAHTAGRIGEGARPVIVNTRLVLRPDHVADRAGRFDGLWESATALD